MVSRGAHNPEIVGSIPTPVMCYTAIAVKLPHGLVLQLVNNKPPIDSVSIGGFLLSLALEVLGF